MRHIAIGALLFGALVGIGCSPSLERSAHGQAAQGDSKEGAPATERANKLAVPADKLLAEAEKKMRSAFGKELAAAQSPADRRKLAGQMLRTASESKEDPPAAFILMRTASELAATAGDLDLAWQAWGQVASQYEVDLLQLSLGSLKTAADAATEPAQYEALIGKHEELIERCIAAERFDLLDGIAASAERVAGALGGAKVVFAWKERREMLAEVSAVAAAGAAAKAALNTNPQDATAHVEVGRYLCFVKGDWPQGLAHLAKGDDPMLSSLAERELKQSAEKEAQIALGDGWREVADKLSGRMRSACLTHAKAHYQSASASLSGLDRALAEKRLQELSSELGDAKVAQSASVMRESYAARFTDQAHVEIQNSEGLLNLNRDFTIEVWARWPADSQSEYLAGDEAWPQYPKDISVTRTRGWVLRYRVFEGKPVLDFTVAIDDSREWLSTMAPVQVDQQWHHVAACRTKDTIVLYLDGEPIAQSKVDAALVSSPTPVYLGCRKQCFADRRFTGDIGRFRISNSARYSEPFMPQGNWTSDERTLIHFDFRSPAKGRTIRDTSGNDLAGVFSPGVSLERLGQDAIPADGPIGEPPPEPPQTEPKSAAELPLVGTFTILYANQVRREYVFDRDGTVTITGMDTAVNTTGPVPRAAGTDRAHVVWRRTGDRAIGLIYWDQHQKFEVVSVERNGKPNFALYVLEHKTVGSGESTK